MTQYYQGDLLFVSIQHWTKPHPTPLQVYDMGVPLELARGEATGHRHTVEWTPSLRVYPSGNGILTMNSEEAIVVNHDEHPDLTLPPGAWEVRRQREYRPNDIRFRVD